MSTTCEFCGFYDDELDVGEDSMYCPIINEIVDDKTPACGVYVDEEIIFG